MVRKNKSLPCRGTTVNRVHPSNAFATAFPVTAWFSLSGEGSHITRDSHLAAHAGLYTLSPIVTDFRKHSLCVLNGSVNISGE